MAEYGGIEEFFGKIDVEGSTIDALDYGLTTEGYDLPAEVVESWGELVRRYRELEPLMEEFWERYAPPGYNG